MTNYPQARYLWETRNTPAGVHLTGTLLQRMRETSETLFLVPLFFFARFRFIGVRGKLFAVMKSPSRINILL